MGNLLSRRASSTATSPVIGRSSLSFEDHAPPVESLSEHQRQLQQRKRNRFFNRFSLHNLPDQDPPPQSSFGPPPVSEALPSISTAIAVTAPPPPAFEVHPSGSSLDSGVSQFRTPATGGLSPHQFIDPTDPSSPGAKFFSPTSPYPSATSPPRQSAFRFPEVSGPLLASVQERRSSRSSSVLAAQASTEAPESEASAAESSAGNDSASLSTSVGETTAVASAGSPSLKKTSVDSATGLFYLPTAGTLQLKPRGSLASRRSSSAAGQAAASEKPGLIPLLSVSVPPVRLDAPPSAFPSPQSWAKSTVAAPSGLSKATSANHLQPPRLNLSFFTNPPALVPDSPMSAGHKPGAQLSIAISAQLKPEILPVWLDRLAAKGPANAPAYLERLFRRIEDTEYRRIRSMTPSPSTPKGPPAAATSTPTTASMYSTSVSCERGNLRRNRYTDIIPYDRTRVPLLHPSPVRRNPNAQNQGPPLMSDYINASFLDTHPQLNPDGTPLNPRCTGRQYISTQGPLPETVVDFWNMVVDRGSRLIVMLTREEERGRPKCHRYWPEDSHAAVHGAVGVRCGAVENRNDVVIRELWVSREQTGDVERRVWHLQFLIWPDHKSSDVRAVLNVVELADSLQRREEDEAATAGGGGGGVGPMIVHCSAGCGRTGTFCTIDSVLRQLEGGMFLNPLAETSSTAEDATMIVDSVVSPFKRPTTVRPSPMPVSKVFSVEASDDPDECDDPVLACVMRLRSQRVSMVQTLEQFTFCYEAVVTRIVDWVADGRPITWTPIARPSLRPGGISDDQPRSAGPLASAGPKSAGGWNRPPIGKTSAGSSGLEPLSEKSPSSTGGGSPTANSIPPTPGPVGKAFDWDAVLKRTAGGAAE